MKHFKYFVAVCLCCSFLIPDRVFADTATYTLLSGSDCVYAYISGTTNNNKRYTYLSYNNLSAGRGVVLYDGTYYRIGIVSESSFTGGLLQYTSAQSSCPVASQNAVLSNGYYIIATTLQVYQNNYFLDWPIVNTNEQGYSALIKYTFGEGAVDPAPPLPDYGQLLDVKFSTSIAGNGSAAVNNIDHITWNPEMDSNGIQFDGTERVQIKAIAGNYTSNSRNGIFGLGATDFDYNSGEEHMLAEYPATRGYYDVSWSHVIQQLNAGSISDFLNIRLKSDDIWLKSGWIYQIRLIVGNYESQWITIYNATSSGVQNSLNVENSTEINMNLVNTIQQINTINNSVTNWEIDNTTINMENQDGTETTDKPWWAYLLEALVSLLNGILGFLGNLIGDLIDAIVSLFQPDEFTINNYNEYKLELKQNSGIFGQSIDFITTLKNTFTGVQYQEPIIHWQGISFGETELIPAADYNLNDYVTMWGLGDFRTMAYLCSDGFICFSLLVLIVRKLNEVLKK